MYVFRMSTCIYSPSHPHLHCSMRLLPSLPTRYHHYPPPPPNKLLSLPTPTKAKLVRRQFMVYSTSATSQQYRPIETHHHIICHCDDQQKNQPKQKVLVIMGPTGSGKSKLSVDLAHRFFPGEILNSDKIQVYRGLDITTNKISAEDRHGVPHHLLGEVDPTQKPELTPVEYRSVAASKISEIASRRKLPIVAGGSNSYMYALAANRFDPEKDVFRESRPDPVTTRLRYECCFIYVDVSMPVLNQYLAKRVDDMLESGMFEELAQYFDSDEFRRTGLVSRNGLTKAIGVPEFEEFFRRFPPDSQQRRSYANPRNDPVRKVAYEEAVRAIKANTWRLAKRQVEKIQRLRDCGWDLRRVDATEVVKAAMGLLGADSGSRKSGIWEKQVVEPSVKIVKKFLE